MVTSTLPEEIVTAVFYKAGKNVSIEDNQQFDDIFDKTAQTFGGEFLQFRAHPSYRYSRTLLSTMQNLLNGGSIIREGLSNRVRASPHTLGPYGERVFQALDEDTRETVCHLAKMLQEAYPLSPLNTETQS